MPSVTVTVEPNHINMTGTAFMVYGRHYHDAVAAWLQQRRPSNRFDAVSYQLLCQSLELHLKSFVWLTDRIGHEQIKNRYGHNLQRLWDHAKQRGINKYARITPLRETAVSLVAPYYKGRQFTYLDLDMVFRGYKGLKAHPKTVPTLLRLTARLGKALRSPILRAS